MGGHGRDLAEVARELVAARLPGEPAGPVTRLGAGLDHVAFEVGDLIVRFGKDPDAAARAAGTRREAGLLAAVAAVSPLPVPEPAFTVGELGCLAYRRLPGVPLLDLPAPWRSGHVPPLAAALGGFLGALRRIPAASLAALVEVDDTPPAGWLEEAAATYASVAGAVPAAHRRAVERFLDAPPPKGPATREFRHNDLGIEHVLVDPATWAVTGVIDWGDAAVADPAADLGRLYRDLGPAALDAALRADRAAGGDADDTGLRERAAFYARCGALEDLAFGLEAGGARYVAKSLAALAWLFPGGASG